MLFPTADLDHYYDTPQVLDASSLTMLTVESEAFYSKIVPIDFFFFKSYHPFAVDRNHPIRQTARVLLSVRFSGMIPSVQLGFMCAMPSVANKGVSPGTLLLRLLRSRTK